MAGHRSPAAKGEGPMRRTIALVGRVGAGSGDAAGASRLGRTQERPGAERRGTRHARRRGQVAAEAARPARHRPASIRIWRSYPIRRSRLCRLAAGRRRRRVSRPRQQKAAQRTAAPRRRSWSTRTNRPAPGLATTRRPPPSRCPGFGTKAKQNPRARILGSLDTRGGLRARPSRRTPRTTARSRWPATPASRAAQRHHHAPARSATARTARPAATPATSTSTS